MICHRQFIGYVLVGFWDGKAVYKPKYGGMR